MPVAYNERTTESSNGQVGRPTETRRVGQAIKRAILSGAFPPGEPLQEARLATQFGASRTPIREALQRLEADGLLTITPRRGAVVRQLTVRDFLDVNELRIILEPVAARKAASIIPEHVVSELQTIHAAINVDGSTEADNLALQQLDRQMHTAIAGALQNSRMTQIILNLNDMMQIVREKDMRRRHREMHGSIGEILRAMRDRDAEAAEIAVRRHIADFSGALANLV